MAEPAIDAIVFDVGGVLVPHDNDLLYRTIALRCRSDVSPDDVAVLATDPDIDTGRKSTARLHADLVQRLGYGADIDQFVADWCCHCRFDSSMIALAHALDTRVLLFSNTNRGHWDFLVADPANGLASFERYLSFEMGLAKPSVASFERVARDAGLDPARSLFLDDRHDNVDGARRAGFRAEVFVDEAWLRGYLAEVGIGVRDRPA